MSLMLLAKNIISDSQKNSDATLLRLGNIFANSDVYEPYREKALSIVKRCLDELVLEGEKIGRDYRSDNLLEADKILNDISLISLPSLDHYQRNPTVELMKNRLEAYGMSKTDIKDIVENICSAAYDMSLKNSMINIMESIATDMGDTVKDCLGLLKQYLRQKNSLGKIDELEYKEVNDIISLNMKYFFNAPVVKDARAWHTLAEFSPMNRFDIHSGVKNHLYFETLEQEFKTVLKNKRLKTYCKENDAIAKTEQFMKVVHSRLLEETKGKSEKLEKKIQSTSKKRDKKQEQRLEQESKIKTVPKKTITGKTPGEEIKITEIEIV